MMDRFILTVTDDREGSDKLKFNVRGYDVALKAQVSLLAQGMHAEIQNNWDGEFTSTQDILEHVAVYFRKFNLSDVDN